jgi:hypothetical protein
VAGEVIAVKQIEVPLDGMVRCYWWRHLEDERGFMTDQPLDPDGWQLRQSTAASSMSSGTVPADRSQRLASGSARLLPRGSGE